MQIVSKASASAMQTHAGGRRLEADGFGSPRDRNVFQNGEHEQCAVNGRELLERRGETLPRLQIFNLWANGMFVPRKGREQSLVSSGGSVGVAGQIDGRDEQPGENRPGDQAHRLSFPPQFEECGGRDVLGIVGRAQQAKRTTVNTVTMKIEESAERVTIVAAGSFPQIGLVVLAMHHT